jgi:carboxymethylenebutenolidase
MPIRTSKPHIEGLTAYLAQPQSAADVGMLLLPMISGNGAQLRKYADSIAESGVMALSWDPFHGPSGDDTSADDLMKLGGGITDANAQAEQTRWLDYMLSELKLTKVGVIGWCMGGRLALILAARERRLANCVAYHPTIRRPAPPNHTSDPIALASDIRCPVQGIYPGADALVTRETYDELQRALEKRDAITIGHFYPGAEHAFMDPHRQGSEANRTATRAAWPQTLAFIKATLALLCVFLTAAASVAEAQEVASSFEQLRALLKPGETVSVTDTDGRETTGTIADLSSSSLGLLIAGTRHDVPERDVKTMRQRRGDSLWNGVRWAFCFSGVSAPAAGPPLTP